MVKTVLIYKKIKSFNTLIDNISGDKSLSIRWALMASQAIGKSRAYNILNSEDPYNFFCLYRYNHLNMQFFQIHKQTPLYNHV